MFKSLLSLGFIATTALAQSAYIGLPTAGTQLEAGANYTFQIQRPDSLTGSEEIAVVIGLQQCVHECASPDETMGTVLYNGPFNPQFHEAGPPPYQNFSLQVPSSIVAQNALVSVAHFSLVGASYYPLVEYLNQTVTLVEATQ